MVGITVPSGMKVESKKKKLIQDLTEEWPMAYSSNTQKEETLLEYVEDFRRQFVQVFPERRPLLLCPLNEAGVRKFVCTSVRPTLLPHENVYDMQDLSYFVADFFEYLQLDDPTKLPDLLPSPTTSVALRTADCLDMSNFLVSLLRGAAYDAYVVSGYAPKWVCVQDETKAECPLLDETENELDKEARLEAEAKTRERLEKEANEAPVRPPESGEEDAVTTDDLDTLTSSSKEKYKLREQPDHTSKYLAIEERKAKQRQLEKQAIMEAKGRFVEDEVGDPLDGNRVHCWILVLAGKRDVEQSFYIETTTGKIWPVKDSPYMRVESVWNEANYWVNVQDASAQDLSFDLTDSNCWEYVLIEDRKAETEDAPVEAFGEDQTAVAPTVQAPPEEAQDDRDILDCPISWCKPVAIDRHVFRARYPGGSRTIHYHRCTVQKFSEHQEEQMGLVLRVVIFQTNECITPVEIREKYMHRADLLHSRYVYPLSTRVHLIFSSGRHFGLKDYIVMDSARSFTFHPKARVDGMVRRNELLGVKVVEEFEERDDQLIYRSVKVGKSTEITSSSYLIQLAPHEKEGSGVPVLKITQKYSRNEAVPANQDVRKRTHFIADQKIRLDYHYAKRSITAASLLLDKTDRQIGSDSLGDLDHSTGRLRDGDKPNPFAKEHKELLSKLIMKEKDMLSEVRDDEKEMTTLLQELATEAVNVKIHKSIYDLAQEAVKEDEKEDDEETDENLDKNTVDYLSPFLAQYKGVLDHRQAMQAKDECLAALKERLLERANIIQQHLDDENQKLHQKRTMFKRQTGSGAVEADEEFTKFYEQSAFRIDILRARLARHEKLALEKYVEMDNRLNNDKRLKALKHHPEKDH